MSYRYGFNTQERVDEIDPNHYTAMYWEYDSRLGRRWNLDPKYSFDVSRYSVNGNNPVYYTDPYGDFKTKFGAFLYKVFNGGGTISKATTGKHEGEYFVGKKVDYNGEGAGVAYERNFDWGKSNISKSYSSAKNWFNNSELFFKVGGKIDIGVQAGAHLKTGPSTVQLEGSLFTVDLLKVEYEQREASYGPESFDFDYVGKNNEIQVSQYAGASLFAGAEYEHSFKGNLNGGYSEQTHTGTVNASAVQYQVEKSSSKVTNSFSITVGGRGALILGIEGEASFGVRDKTKK